MKHQILVVDDDLAFRKLVKYSLKKFNVSVVEAENGEEAITQLLNNYYKMVILDWKMPGLGGEDTLLLTDYVTSNSKLGLNSIKVPVIVYTSCIENEIQIPETKHFKVLGLVHKSVRVERQLRKIRTMVQKILEKA